jgi:hypothetical protein
MKCQAEVQYFRGMCCHHFQHQAKQAPSKTVVSRMQAESNWRCNDVGHNFIMTYFSRTESILGYEVGGFVEGSINWNILV